MASHSRVGPAALILFLVIQQVPLYFIHCSWRWEGKEEFFSLCSWEHNFGAEAARPLRGRSEAGLRLSPFVRGFCSLCTLGMLEIRVRFQHIGLLCFKRVRAYGRPTTPAQRALKVLMFKARTSQCSQVIYAWMRASVGQEFIFLQKDLLVVFSACGGMRTGNNMPVLTAYFPFYWFRACWKRVDCLWHYH